MVQRALARALAVLMLFMDLDAPSHLPLHLQYALSMGNSRSLPRLLSFFSLFSRNTRPLSIIVLPFGVSMRACFFFVNIYARLSLAEFSLFQTPRSSLGSWVRDELISSGCALNPQGSRTARFITYSTALIAFSAGQYE